LEGVAEWKTRKLLVELWIQGNDDYIANEMLPFYNLQASKILAIIIVV
jgi:hypothetical protein